MGCCPATRKWATNKIMARGERAPDTKSDALVVDCGAWLRLTPGSAD